MTTKYKLVTQDYKTRKGRANETTWKIGETVTATGDPEQGLCSDAYVHCYDSLELAVFLNPIHANIENPRILEVETHDKGVNDHGLKRGYRSMTPIREIECPCPTVEQRVKFAISCAKAVYTDKNWNAWADKWSSGEDCTRDADAADAAADAAAYAAHDAARAAVYAARAAARAAARDADAAADAARAAAYAAHDAARAAVYAARAAARAAADAAAEIDLVAIAKEALSE